MKYIDEGVKIKISGFNIAKSAQYRYTVYWSGDAEPFFDGYCYLLEGQTEKEFDITDIIKSHNISSVETDYRTSRSGKGKERSFQKTGAF